MQNLFFVTFSIIFPVFISAYQGTIFPKPVNLQLGTEVTYLSKDFKFNQIQESQSVLLANAIDRYEKLINVEQSPSDLSPSSTTQIKECSINVTQVITRSEHTSHIIQLTLERRSLAIDSDYSHTLQVNDKDGSCVITANTIWGAMYAMESFTHQLVRESTSHYKKRRSLRSGGSSGGEHDEDKEHDHIGHDHKHDNKNHDNKNNKDKDEDKDEDEDEDEDGDESSSDVFYIYCNNTSLYVSDSSRFSHRGLLLDSARHYLPLSQVRSVIDTLPMNKMNILHWHLSDAQSCPLALTSTPDMIKGAWNPTAIYTDKDIKHINDYAADRGVYVLFEIDVPGHTGAWRFGYPELMADCLQKYTNVNGKFSL